MRTALAPVAALLLSVGLLLMGNGLQGTLLPVRAQVEDFSSLAIGILGSSYFLGFGAGCLLGAALVERSGHIRTFTAMVALASTTVLLHGMVLSPVVWWVLRALTGFCFAVLYMVIESWLNEKATNENRGLVFSAYTIVNLTVITLGQLMLTLDQPMVFTLFALASILISLAALPVAFTRAQAPQPIASTKIRIGHLFQRSPVGVFGCFAVGLSNGAFWSLAPIFAQGGGDDTDKVAFFMSIAVIAGAVGQWPLGRLSDRMDRRRVIIAACLGGALAGGALVAAAYFAPNWLYLAAFAFGFFAFPLYALCVAHMNDFVDPAGYVEASAGLLLVFAVGAVVGPIAASAIVRGIGLDGLFVWTAVVHVLTAAFAAYRMRKRAPTPQEEHIPFTEALVVSQTVSHLDPMQPVPEPADPGTAEPPEDGAAVPNDAGEEKP